MKKEIPHVNQHTELRRTHHIPGRSQSEEGAGEE